MIVKDYYGIKVGSDLFNSNYVRTRFYNANDPFEIRSIMYGLIVYNEADVKNLPLPAYNILFYEISNF